MQNVGMSEEERLRSLAPAGASVPEAMVYGWLTLHKREFMFQQPFMGGRNVPGGAVVDFVIFDTMPYTIIRVQGYYHNHPAQAEIDVLQKSSLEEMGYIVEDIWEWEIQTLQSVNDIMAQILVYKRRLDNAQV